MPKVMHVEKARKSPGDCCGCGETIAAGSPYKHIAFRYGGKRIKCGKCNFRQSELTQSKMSGVYAAQESCEDAIASWDPTDGNVEDLKSVLGWVHVTAQGTGHCGRSKNRGWTLQWRLSCSEASRRPHQVSTNKSAPNASVRSSTGRK